MNRLEHYVYKQCSRRFGATLLTDRGQWWVCIESGHHQFIITIKERS